ncbi:unnamed protein product [Laminaria digitata]
MGEGKSEVQGGAVHACIADRDKDGVAPISETYAEGITRTKRRRVDGLRRLFVSADNLIIELSEHCYIDTVRKTQLLTCGCDPEKAADDNHRCNRCSCKGKICSLLCGCKGRCYLGSPPSAVVSTDVDSRGGNAEGGGGESDRERESDGEIVIDASGGLLEPGGNMPIDILGGGGPDVLGWLSDSDDDVASKAESGLFFEGFTGEGVNYPDLMEEVDM